MSCLQLDEAQRRTLHEMGIHHPHPSATATGTRRDAGRCGGHFWRTPQQHRELGALVAATRGGRSVPSHRDLAGHRNGMRAFGKRWASWRSSAVALSTICSARSRPVTSATSATAPHAVICMIKGCGISAADTM